eukprot:TRINITY_DN553_c0_g2_i1.p1 TRINITY_DN553_c0_g2~~TRINITY_DN553_c0_g2_i1.p1  ORF type:complete len:701 (-),score=114.21 TRINITY_DN553_c0_g2_i1:768-2870(-)
MTSVYTWGCNQNDRLGGDNSGSFQKLVDFDNRPIKHVAAGRRGTAVLTEDGELFLFGGFGAIGASVKTSSKDFIPEKILGVSCGLDCVAFYTEKNEVWAWGAYLSDKSDPSVVHKFPNDVQIKQIACGATHCLILTNKGVYAWGQNNQGQMGIDEQPGAVIMMRMQYHNVLPVNALRNKNIVQIACGGYHSLALTDAGEVYAFGAGGYGQLGTGNKNNQQFPTMALELASKQINFIAAGPSHSIAISTDGKAYLFGRTESKQCNCTAPENACVQPVEVAIKDEFFVYAAAAHSCTYLVTVRGKIYDFGVLWSESDNLMVGKNGGVFKDTFIHQLWCGHYHAIAVVGDMRVNISPSTYIANMQIAYNDTVHKDMTLVTPHGTKQVHAVILSSLSDVVAQKARVDKSTVNIVEELKQLSPEQLAMLLKYCYGISSEVKSEDLKALNEAAKCLELSQLVKDCASPHSQEGSFIVVSLEGLTSILSKTFKAQEDRFSDITFTFDNCSSKLYAHKIILSSRCEYFRGLFDLGMKESKQNTMHITEWSFESFKIMLQFLYSDQLEDVTGENALEVLQLATTYLIQRLVDKCEEFIVENMTLDNVVELYQFAETVNAKQLQRGCQFLVRREAGRKESSTVPNYDKLTQAQKNSLATLSRTGAETVPDVKASDVQIQLTPYKFVDQSQRGKKNYNNDKSDEHKRCNIS